MRPRSLGLWSSSPPWQTSGTEQAPIVAIEEAIHNLHGCAASFRESTWVEETFEGEPVWADEVHLFDLEGHPTASLCYGWAYPVEEGSRRVAFVAILHEPPINSPNDAVRAFLVEKFG